MKKQSKQLLVLMCSLLLTYGCATATQAPAQSSNTPSTIGGNKSAILNSDSNRNTLGNYSLQIIQTGKSAGQYVRVSALQLDDNMPVMVAVSTTDLHNQTFVDILKNSGTNSIGDKLLAQGTSITRDGDYEFSHTLVGNIQNKAAREYLMAQGYDKKVSMYTRTSYFSYKHETMTVVEYIPHSERYTNEFFVN